jgi:hypothetical protein
MTMLNMYLHDLDEATYIVISKMVLKNIIVKLATFRLVNFINQSFFLRKLWIKKNSTGEGKAALTDIVSIKVACYGSTLHIFTCGMLLALSK